ncbi:MAG: toll/interleukin-1 receptor domain-containing protein [Magnetococcus sp. DMHC-1]
MRKALEIIIAFQKAASELRIFFILAILAILAILPMISSNKMTNNFVEFLYSMGYCNLFMDVKKISDYSQYIIMILATILLAFLALLNVKDLHKRMRIRRSPNVFISYAHEDLLTAKKIVESVRNAGLNPWLDVEQIVPGQNIMATIEHALEECSSAVVFLSKNSVNSDHLKREIAFAIKLFKSRGDVDIPIIPVRLDDTPVPDILKHIQWADMRSPDAEKQILRGLSRLTGLQLNLENSAVVNPDIQHEFKGGRAEPTSHAC